MTIYLAILSWLSWACLIVVFVLMLVEAIGRPKAMLCDCRMFPSSPYHLDTPCMLGVSIGCAGGHRGGAQGDPGGWPSWIAARNAAKPN